MVVLLYALGNLLLVGVVLLSSLWALSILVGDVCGCCITCQGLKPDSFNMYIIGRSPAASFQRSICIYVGVASPVRLCCCCCCSCLLNFYLSHVGYSCTVIVMLILRSGCPVSDLLVFGLSLIHHSFCKIYI